MELYKPLGSYSLGLCGGEIFSGSIDKAQWQYEYEKQILPLIQYGNNFTHKQYFFYSITKFLCLQNRHKLTSKGVNRIRRKKYTSAITLCGLWVTCWAAWSK